MNILIAGASKGIGLGLVSVYLEQGARVAAVVRNADTADGLTAMAQRYPQTLSVITCDLNELTAGSTLRAAVDDTLFDRIVFNAGVKIPVHQEVTAATACGVNKKLASNKPKLSPFALWQTYTLGAKKAYPGTSRQTKSYVGSANKF